MLCQISGVFRTPNGEVHPNALVKFRRSAGVHAYTDVGGPVVVVPDEVVMVTSIAGLGEVDLYPGRYQVQLLGSDDKLYRFTVNVPDEVSILFGTLLSQAADYGDGGELNTIAGFAAAAFDSQVAAALSETNAEADRVASSASAAAALVSQTAAGVSAAAALVSENAAELAETNAETAQAAAELAETNAETANGTAQTAATTATTQAGIATTKAAEADADAATATTQAGIATTKAAEAAASAVSSLFTGFGLGITGNAPILTNLDDAVIGSGWYRFTSLTVTGTFPPGVAAADAGIVEYIRQSTNRALMKLFHYTTGRWYIRGMNTGVWQAWNEVIEIPVGAARGATLRLAAAGWQTLALPAARQLLGSDGLDAVWQPRIELKPLINAAGQTIIEFPGIPAGVNRVTVNFRYLVTSGIDAVLIQLGDVSSYPATGYNMSFLRYDTTTTNETGYTQGFGLFRGLAADFIAGFLTLNRSHGTAWGIGGSIKRATDRGGIVSGSSPDLASELTRLRITTVGGTDTFSTGGVSISWE